MYLHMYSVCTYMYVYICRAVYRIFAKGGANLEYVKKRGGEAICSCRAATGGWGGVGILGGERITQGGANTPAPPKYTPDLYTHTSATVRTCTCMCMYVGIVYTLELMPIIS